MGHRLDGWRERGFTLVEVLAVIAILSMLMGLLIVGANRYRQRAYVEGSRGVLEKVRAALEEYRSTYGSYPPDGLDAPTFSTRGGGRVQIRGAQCLVEYLVRPTYRVQEFGDEQVRQEVDPFLEVKADNLTGTGDLEARLQNVLNELVDAFSNPIHYDNTERDKDGNVRLSLQSDTSMHTSPGFVASEQHGPDPRIASGSTAQNPGTYDLWSHGVDVQDPTDDLSNWSE